MPWWEKLYYELFDPQAITCSTYPVVPAWPILALLIGAIVAGLIIAYLYNPYLFHGDTKID